MISVDGYFFFTISDLTCHLEDTEKVFSGCTVLPDSKEVELRSMN